MELKEYKIESEQGLQEIAQELAPKLKTGDVVVLNGTLGAGKTTFARYLINFLAGEEVEVPSPTFTLVQEYDLPNISIWHFDLYRLEGKEEDILELGWEEARRYGVSLVEWADRLGSFLPKEHIEVNFDFINDSPDSWRSVIIKNKIKGK